jgi:PAS domain S-box-containing protein
MGESLTSDEDEPSRRARLGVRLLACAILAVALLDLASPASRTLDGAAAFGGLACALLLASAASPRTRRAGQGAAALVVLACLLALAQGLAGRDLVPLSGLADGEELPTAAAFALALLSWAVVMAPESGALPRTLGVLVGATGALALLGRLYAVPELARLPATRVTDATAALAVASGLGVLFLRPERGLPAAVLDGSEAGRELRRLLPVALLLPAAFGGLVLGGERAGWYQGGLPITLFAIALTLALLTTAFASYTALRRSELERRRFRSELAASEERYRRTFEQARIGIAHVAPDGRWLRVNERLCEILGYDEGELLRKTYAEVSHLPDLELDVKQWELLRRGTIADYGVERRFETKDGEVVHADVRLVREEDPSGALRHLIVVIQDITGRKLSEGTLRVYERALAATQNGVVITDATQDEHRIAYANPAYLQITGYTAAELIGKNPRILNAKARDQAALDEVRRALGRGQPCSVLLRNHRKDGEPFWNELSIAPVEDAKGRLTHFIGVVIDATERVQALGEREELLASAEAARQQAEAANHAKDRFLSVVSHELRSPLNAILAWTSLLRDDGAKEDLARAVESIEASVHVQTRLVNDLLDASRIRGGALEIEPVRVDLAAAVRRAASHVEPVAREKGVSLSVAAPGPALAVADAQRIEQVVGNLLDNALKFTPRGGRVSVELAEGETDWRIDVVDDGCGIAADALPRVFEEFWQGERKGASGGRGLGLGLLIVKHLVERHGGTVHLDSDGEGRGTRARVELPKTAVAAPAAEADAPAADLSGLDVVVVDDDAGTLDAIGTALVRAGARARLARSVSEAQALLAERTADVLVSDIGMPDRDGFDLIRAVRADAATAALLAIAVTGLVEPDERRRIRRAGFDAYLPKPARPDVVIDRILKLRARQHAPEPPRRRVLTLEPAGAEGELAALLRELGHQVRTAASAEEALHEASRSAPQLVFVRAGADFDATALAERLVARGVRADLVGLVGAGSEPDLRAFDRIQPAALDLGALDRALRFAEET